MARLNTNAQLSPQKVGAEVDEAEAAAGSDDEHTANILRMSLNSGKKPAAPSNGIFSSVRRVFGLEKRQAAEEMFYPSKNSADNNNEPAVADAAGDEGSGPGDTAVTSPTKRKRDTYDFSEAHPEQAEQGNVLQKPPYEKLRATREAKTRLGLPRSSKAPAVSQRQTRASRKPDLPEPEAEIDPPISNSAMAYSDVQLPNPSKRRGRGRPPKQQAVASHVSSDLPEVQNIGRTERPNDEAEEDGEDEDNDPDSATAEQGISDILLNPSPVKPIPSGTTRRKSAGPPQERVGASQNSNAGVQRPSQQSQRQPATNPRTDGLDVLSDSEIESANEEAAAPNGPSVDAPEDENDREDKLSETIGDIISADDVEKMLETAHTVGHKRNPETGQWELKRAEAGPGSVPGKRIRTRLNRLIKACNKLQSAKTGRDESLENTALKEIAEMLRSLEEWSEVVVKKRLGPSAEGSIYNMLIDVYFVLVPEILEALKELVKVNQDEELANIEAMQHIVSILVILRKLAEAATRQPKEDQPKASKNNQYRIMLSTKYILPQLRRLQQSTRVALHVQERAERLAAWNKEAPERLRVKQALEKKREEERRREDAQIARVQNEQFYAELRGNPILDCLVQHGLKKTAERPQKTLEMQATRSESRVQESEHEVKGVEDDEERLKIFPRSDRGKQSGPRPLTQEEKEVFVDIMQFEEKAVRYELAAQRLGRSLEEVFNLAKNLQEAFDGAHERGEKNEPCDEWTYDIYVQNSQ